MDRVSYFCGTVLGELPMLRPQRIRSLALAGLTLAVVAYGAADGQADNQKWLRIAWETDFAAAQKAATASSRPILVILMSGDVKGKC